jgi:hypothetical protein
MQCGSTVTFCFSLFLVDGNEATLAMIPNLAYGLNVQERYKYGYLTSIMA